MKAKWEAEPNGALRMVGDNSGAEFQIEAGLAGNYLLFIDGRALPYGFETVAEAQEEAEEIDANDEDANNTFRGDFAGFAGSH